MTVDRYVKMHSDKSTAITDTVEWRGQSWTVVSCASFDTTDFLWNLTVEKQVTYDRPLSVTLSGERPQPVRRWVAVDIGCLECRIDTEIVGVYPTVEQAQAEADRINIETVDAYQAFMNGPQGDTHLPSGRLPGQHQVEVFQIEVDL